MPETEIRPRLRFAIDRSAKLSQTPGQSGTIPARQYTVIQSISLFAFDQDDIIIGIKICFDRSNATPFSPDRASSAH